MNKIQGKEWRLNNLYKIVNKQWNTIKFKLNDTQNKLFNYQRWNKRIIILKARQLWMSTYKIIEGLDRALFFSNQTIIITAHKQEKLKELFEKAKFAYDNMPEAIKIKGWYWNKPVAHYNNANELYFKDINSRIKVSLDSRSWTPTSLHITELAFLDRAKEMWTWSLPSMPKDAPITVETTANGIWNFFYDLWHKYKDKDDWEFKTLFFPWYDDPNYVLDKDLDIPDELSYLNNLWLTKQQINWYVNQYDILWREVFQEYPSTPSEAFLSTWNPVFNLNKLKQLSKLEYKIDDKYKDLRIYWKISNDCIYWVDTAKGWLDGDNSCITIRDRELKLLACYYGKCPPDQLWEIIEYTYNLWYKSQNIWIEVNNTWISTIDYLKNTKLAPYIYWQTVVDERTQKKTKKLWFNTNAKTRPLILNDIEELVRKDLITQIDDRVKIDFMHFIYNDNWRPEAQQWQHDDWVMAEAICCYMRKQPKQIVFS